MLTEEHTGGVQLPDINLLTCKVAQRRDCKSLYWALSEAIIIFYNRKETVFTRSILNAH